jgi:Ankyrin repeats (3 copies)/Ankyrin repeats (many copies)
MTLHLNFKTVLGRFTSTIKAALDRGSPAHQGMVSKILSWIAWSMRPLESHEMFAALATRAEIGVFARYSSNSDEFLKPVTNEELISLCPSLLEIRYGGQVAFQHEDLRSVIRSPWSRHLGFGPAEATHESIAAVCFRHLTCISKETILDPWIKTGAMLRGETKRCHFRSYCTNYWQDHYRAAEASSRKLVAMLHGTLEAAFNAAPASKGLETSSPISRLSTGIWICSVWDLKILGRTYLEMGAEIDRCSGSGEAPLHVAAANSSLHMLQLLLDRGASLKVRDRYGCTVLQQACRAGSLDVVTLLLQKGADLESLQNNAEDAFTNTLSSISTPLQLAANYGHSEIVRVLLEAGCSQSAPTAVCGWTALHLAVDCGSEDAVRYLVEWGADIEAKSASFETAFEIAIRERRDSIVRYLAHRGAKREVCTTKDELYLNRVLASESVASTVHHFQSMSFETADVSMDERSPVQSYISRSSPVTKSCTGLGIQEILESESECDWILIDKMELEA